MNQSPAIARYPVQSFYGVRRLSRSSDGPHIERVYMSTRRIVYLSAVLMGGIIVVPAFAAPFYIIQKDTRYTQVDGNAPTVATGFDLFATVTTPGTFDGGTVTKPGGGTLTLSNTGTQLQFGSGVITNQTTFTN